MSLQGLYNKMHDAGDYTKTFEDFKGQYGTKEGMDKLYNGLTSDGAYTKSKDEFADQYYQHLKKKEPTVSDGQESTSKVQGLPQESVSSFRTVASPKDWYKETQKTKPERIAKEPVIEKFDTGVKTDEEQFEQKVAETYNTDVNPANRIDKFNKELLGLKLKYDPLIVKDENAITEYNKEATEKAELLGLQFKDGKVGLEPSEQKYWQENYTRIWDDMLKEKAKNEKDSFAKSVLNKLGSGSGKDVMLTPYRAFKASEKIWNAVVPSSMESQYWADFVNLNDDKLQEMSAEGDRYEQGAIDMLKSGDISGAVGNIALDVSESLPMLTTLVIGNAAGGTKSALGYMGASKGFAEYDRLDRETELPEFVKITNALTKGLNEVVWEQWGTVKILDGVKKAVADKGRNQISKELAGAYYSKLDKAVSHLGAWGKDIKREALSEGATQLSDNIVDIASGLKPVEELFDQVGNSMLVGGVIGGGISLPAHIPTSDKSKYIRSVAKSVPEEFSTDSKIDIVKEVIKREEFDYKAKNTNNEGIKAAYEKIVKSSDQKIVDIIARENGYEQDTEKKGSQLKQSEELAVTQTDTGKEIKELTTEQKVYKEQLSKRTPDELAQLPSFGGKKFTMATVKPNGDISNVYLGGGDGASHNQYMTPEDADLYEQGRLTIGVYSKRLGEFMEAPQKGVSFGSKVMKSAFSKVEEPINEKEQKTETGKILEGETGRIQEPVTEPTKVESAVKDIPELQFLEQDLPTKKPDKIGNKPIKQNQNAETTGTIPETSSVEEIRDNGEQASPEVYMGKQGDAEVPPQEVETFESAVTKGLDKGIEWLDDIDKQLSKFGKETLGVNLPVAVAQTGVKAAKIALQAGKTVSEAIDYAINEIRNTDWYKGLADKDKINAENKVKGVFTGETKIKPETTEPSLTGVRVESTEATREEFGIGQREKVKTLSDVELTQKADEQIKQGYNIESLITKMEDGTLPSDLDQRIIRQYLSGLEKQFESNPNDDQLLKIKRAVDASDIAGTMLSASFRSRKGEIIRDDSLAGFFIEDMNNLGVDKLTSKQKEIIQKEWEQINDLKKKLEDKIAELEAKQARDKAEKEFKKQRNSTKTSGKKTHEDFIYERKQILSSLAGKWKEASRDNTLSALPLPYAKQLAYITPDVAKLMKSYIEEGIQNLDEMITKLHSDIKPFIPDIQEKDIHNLIAGEYKEPAKTRSELTIKLQDLRTEAKLINKYEDLEKGVEPKSERRKILRNKELADLRKQIREHDLTKLSQAKSRIKLETEKIQDDLKTGNYANEKKKTEIQLDKEGLELKDKLIQARQERTVRILKDKYANRTDLERAGDLAIEIINTSRALMTSGDMSGIFRQALIPVISHPIMAMKYFAKTFSHIKSEKEFSRWLYDVFNSPDYPIMKESGLYVSNPINPELSAKEEVFMGNLAEKIPIIGKYLVKPSERAYISFLNQFRVGLFRRMAEQYLSDGKTYYNNPKLYKETAKLINNETGRGGLGKLEGIAKYLNTPIFAPRLIASRLNLITNAVSPKFYLEVPKEVRVEYWKDMIKFLGVGTSVLGLAALAGADVEEDWRSTDFGKIKIGDQRWDIWGGFQPYIRLIGQLVTGETKSATTGKISKLGSGYNEKSRGEVLLHFTRGKLAPAAALSVDVLTGRTMIGENVTVALELKKNLLPLMYSDVSTALKDKGIQSIFTVGVPAFFGVGVQNYPTTGERPDVYTKYGNKKLNALGEEENETDYNVWNVLTTEKFNIQPKAKQELKNYNTEDGRAVKYTTEQYVKYIKARGDYIKEGISNYASPDRDDIISTLKESDVTFKDEDQIEKVADMMILDVRAKYLKNLKQKADSAGELAATGMEGKPSKIQQMINEEEE